MKLEKLNDNQIRCTLNKSDLDKRELRLSELAYGSAKARALFRDMIQQASIELGFEADNIPLMIEAIPISNECLVLVVTKVEDPDELDTRFSRFSSPFDDCVKICDPKRRQVRGEFRFFIHVKFWTRILAGLLAPL